MAAAHTFVRACSKVLYKAISDGTAQGYEEDEQFQHFLVELFLRNVFGDLTVEQRMARLEALQQCVPMKWSTYAAFFITPIDSLYTAKSCYMNSDSGTDKVGDHCSYVPVDKA